MNLEYLAGPEMEFYNALDGPAVYAMAATPAGKVFHSPRSRGQDQLNVFPGLAAKAWEAWRKLPESERAPGTFKPPQAKDSPYCGLKPPPGSLTLDAYFSPLERKDGGEIRRFSKARWKEPLRDHVWMTPADVKSLVPAFARKGDAHAVPAPIVERFCRFHLNDPMQGHTSQWSPDEVRSKEMTLTVEEASGGLLRLRLRGSAAFVMGPNTEDPGGEMKFRLSGILQYNLRKQVLDRFDVVALGECTIKHPNDFWRPALHPVGVAFTLTRGNAPADRLAPVFMAFQGYGVSLTEYFGSGPRD